LKLYPVKGTVLNQRKKAIVRVLSRRIKNLKLHHVKGSVLNQRLKTIGRVQQARLINLILVFNQMKIHQGKLLEKI